MGFTGGGSGKTLLLMQETQETWIQSLGQEYPLEESMATHPGILAWRIHGQRRLAGYSPWSYKQLGTTEVTLFARM